jgi:hypothetical protein
VDQQAMRFDVIIDFSAFPVGSKVYLKENAAQNVGVPAPSPLPSTRVQCPA